MKKRTKVIVGLCALLGATLALAACSYPHAPYDELADENFSVSVRYDRNGGIFSSTEGIDLVDVYSAENLENGIKLVAPGDARRGNQASTSSATRSGYFLAGWYRTRTPRTDASGNPLDEYGELCSASGRPQGYVYSGRWDFAKDYLHTGDVQPAGDEKGKKSDPEKYTVTLYAGWVPNFTYSFYRPAESGEEGWQKYGSFVIDPQTTQSISLPAWNETTGRMNYGSVPVYEKHTITGVYSDRAAEIPFTEEIGHTGVIDYATGTATGFDLPVYTTWEAGTWFRIATPDQLVSNVQTDGCYRLVADLDFGSSMTGWPFGNVTYSGVFDGQNHTVRNVTTTQDITASVSGGLFGEVTAAATVKNTVFENVVYKLTMATRFSDGSYGLFSGKTSESATVEGVTLSGEILLGDLADVNDGKFDNFVIGLVSGNLVDKGISRANIRVKADRVPIGYDDYGAPVYGYPVKGRAEADGSVSVSKNEDPSQNPNED